MTCTCFYCCSFVSQKNIAFLRLHIPPHPLDLSMSLPSSPSLARGGKVGTEVVQASVDQKMTSVEHLVLNLCDPTLRERSLAELSKVLVHPFIFPISAPLEERVPLPKSLVMFVVNSGPG